MTAIFGEGKTLSEKFYGVKNSLKNEEALIVSNMSTMSTMGIKVICEIDKVETRVAWT